MHNDQFSSCEWNFPLTACFIMLPLGGIIICWDSILGQAVTIIIYFISDEAGDSISLLTQTKPVSSTNESTHNKTSTSTDFDFVGE